MVLGFCLLIFSCSVTAMEPVIGSKSLVRVSRKPVQKSCAHDQKLPSWFIEDIERSEANRDGKAQGKKNKAFTDNGCKKRVRLIEQGDKNHDELASPVPRNLSWSLQQVYTLKRKGSDLENVPNKRIRESTDCSDDTNVPIEFLVSLRKAIEDSHDKKREDRVETREPANQPSRKRVRGSKDDSDRDELPDDFCAMLAKVSLE